MTREMALKVSEDNAVFESAEVRGPNLESNIVDAIMEAAAAEREACAKIAEQYECGGPEWDCEKIAILIRARGGK